MLLRMGYLVVVSPIVWLGFVQRISALLIPSITTSNTGFNRRPRALTATKEDGDGSAPLEIDVSDLGLTIEDLNTPLPPDMFEVSETSGYESTSRIPDVQDDACLWTETPTEISAVLAIPGLRGQPAMAMSVLTSKNTISISVFGRVVWSAILRGETIPDTAVFEAREGSDFIPVMEYQVRKADTSKRWDGLILQVGEDSLL